MQQKSLMIYDSIPDSPYTHPRTPGGPLPFRSRDAANQVALIHPQEHGVKWQDLDSLHENAGTDRCRLSSSNKENVESWLETTSPTSVIEQAQSERDPPSPSPICSPSPSSPISSCKRSAAPSSELPNNAIIPSGDDGPSSSRGKRHGKEIVLSSSAHAPPESPTGSSFSSGSEVEAARAFAGADDTNGYIEVDIGKSVRVEKPPPGIYLKAYLDMCSTQIGRSGDIYSPIQFDLEEDLRDWFSG